MEAVKIFLLQRYLLKWLQAMLLPAEVAGKLLQLREHQSLSAMGVLQAVLHFSEGSLGASANLLVASWVASWVESVGASLLEAPLKEMHPVG